MAVGISNLPHRDYRAFVPLPELDATIAPDRAMLRLYRERARDPTIVIFRYRDPRKDWFVGRLYRVPLGDGVFLPRPFVREIATVPALNEWYVGAVCSQSEAFVGFGELWRRTWAVKEEADVAMAAASAAAVSKSFDAQGHRWARLMDALPADNRPRADRERGLRRMDAALEAANGVVEAADPAAFGVRARTVG